MTEERGRSAFQSDGLSHYYRERFGSHSPEEYMNLRISGIDDKLERDEIKMKLTAEFKKFAPFEIKVVRNPDDDERLAYVNFERKDCAKNIRYKLMDRLRGILGRRVLCDPAGILRDQEGKYIPDRFNRTQQLQNERGTRSADRRNPPAPKEPSQFRLRNNDGDATRTLFVGNMPADIRDYEIRRVFEKYGQIEDIDIKTPVNTDAAYAFVMFQSLEQAVEAKNEEQDRPVRVGGPRMKIGYGKSQVSRRLWVGGLGKWCTSFVLAKEFDRYGMIERLEYQEGDDVAYICFEDTHAAQDACKAMKGFPLGGRDRCITVDFAKDPSVVRDTGIRKRRASRSPDAAAPRTPPGSPHAVVRTYRELDEEFASTWHGQLILKKVECAVKIYRIAGNERLLQKLMRDEDGNPYSIRLDQRIMLTSPELQQKMFHLSSKELSLFVVVAKKDVNDLKPICDYFRGRNAAGLATLPSGVLYLLPSDEVTSRLASMKAPNVRLFTEGCSFMLGALCVARQSQSPH